MTTTKRINGKGGDPIIQTKTGGDKTHLFALYHLIKSSDELLKSAVVTQTTGIRDAIHGIMVEAGVDPENQVQAQVCVLQGSFLSPTSSRCTGSGDPLNTLWGEMAWQLGGQATYETVGAAARQGTAPGGEELDNLFHLTGPCVILIDEIVNYARNADLDTISTFFQNLTEAVKRRHDVALIVTLPASTTEAGGERGGAIMAVMENLLNRIQAVTLVAQASNDEVKRQRTSSVLTSRLVPYALTLVGGFVLAIVVTDINLYERFRPRDPVPVAAEVVSTPLVPPRLTQALVFADPPADPGIPPTPTAVPAGFPSDITSTVTVPPRPAPDPNNPRNPRNEAAWQALTTRSTRTASVPAEFRIIVNVARLNVREGPGTDNPIRGSL